MALIRCGGGAVDLSNAQLSVIAKRTYNDNISGNVDVGDYLILVTSSTTYFTSTYVENADIVTEGHVTPAADGAAVALYRATGTNFAWKLGSTTAWGEVYRLVI